MDAATLAQSYVEWRSAAPAVGHGQTCTMDTSLYSTALSSYENASLAECGLRHRRLWWQDRASSQWKVRRCLARGARRSGRDGAPRCSDCDSSAQAYRLPPPTCRGAEGQ